MLKQNLRIMSNEISLVTGGNGHLGNNLVRLLLSENQKVRTTVRNIDNQDPFEGLDCDVVQADITDRESLKKAFKGVTNLYAVAANFSMCGGRLIGKRKLWSAWGASRQGTEGRK